MPIIHVHLLRGRSLSQKRALVEKMTSAVCEAIGVDTQAVLILLHECESEDIAKAGLLFLDSRG
jgi:4-oxalocrotonate tautomerase